MTASRLRLRKALRGVLPAVALLSGVTGAAPSTAQEKLDLAPYIMLRSLQFVQDSVVRGDHSAAEMQRYMLATLDVRLRTAPPAVFNDPRNVDAALIYGMSGGNPATLEYLASRDIGGHFDTRVPDALRKYLTGKGVLATKALAEIALEYRNEPIGPYLALVSGNVSVAQEPAKALEYYDWARLNAPGTNVEEAALRRSVAITIEAGMVDKALAYSRQYARRFIHSPYATQFADFFVMLVNDHFGKISEQDIDGTLEFMAPDRRREIFLRIARAAAIGGKSDLAKLAALKAESIGGNPMPEALARLYGGLANVPTADVTTAMDAMNSVPDEILSNRDRLLRDAAKIVASQVVTRPVAESLAQVTSVNTTMTDISAAPALARGSGKSPTLTVPIEAQGEKTSNFDPAFQTFVDRGRSKLTAIDDLLKEESAFK